MKCDIYIFFFLFPEVAYLWTLECVLVESRCLQKVCESIVRVLAVNMDMCVLILTLLFVYMCVWVCVWEREG